MLACMSILKGIIINLRNPFLKKVPFIFKPADASVTIRGAGGQAPMVFGQAKGNKKPKKTSSYYLYGKKNHIAKIY